MTIYYGNFGYKSISISEDPRLLDREAYKIVLFIVQKVLQEFVVFFNVEIMHCVLLHKTMYVRRNFQYFEVVCDRHLAIGTLFRGKIDSFHKY